MLPDEVREAMEYLDDLILNYHNFDLLKWQTIRAHLLAREAEVKVLRVKCAGSLANNLCPDHRDKQSGKSCLACTIERTEKRAERAEALLRECLINGMDAVSVSGEPGVRDRITAHLSENSRG